MSASSTTNTSSQGAAARDDRMPGGIPFIVANEFAERFCFYGINAILSIYMTQTLRLGQADTTVFHSLFKVGAYFFPLIGAIVSDVFWGKFRTIMTFSLVYASGCAVVALAPTKVGLLVGLGMVAFGTGGIKPCVSANVGDQFTSKNQHLIEKAFSYFYLAINAGSSISILFCPILLEKSGPRLAFGVPAAMMFLATFAFWSGRSRYAVMPPAGRRWLEDVFSPSGLRTILRLGTVYIFIAFFWMLWDQSNGQTWTLQAQSSLMDKDMGPGFRQLFMAINGVPTILPAQIQVVNGLILLALVPIFTFALFPLISKVFPLTPIRKIGMGLFLIAGSFLIVKWIEGEIQAGHRVSVYYQILAYLVLTAAEILVSMVGLEFAYKQAPLRMKSFILALFLLSISVGNAMTAVVNHFMIVPVQVTSATAGAETWVSVADASRFVTGQKIDFGGEHGLNVTSKEGKSEPLGGTQLVAEIEAASGRLRLMDPVDRKPIATTGTFDPAKATVSTYRLVGPAYYNFFAGVMFLVALLFIPVAYFYKEQTHVREHDEDAAG